jgi:membrane protein
LLLGASLSLTSYAVSASKGVVGGMPGGVALLLDLLQFFLMAAGMAAMFRFVPNTYVRWGHAWMGGLFVAAGIELAKKILVLYLSKVPTYSVVYGAFATVPILLVWIYVAWSIVLLGAALTAYVPSLIAGVPRRRGGPGWQFQLALEVLRQLDAAHLQPRKGLTAPQLCRDLRVDAQRLEPVLEELIALDWVGRLAEATVVAGEGDAARYILLVDPQSTVLEPLMQKLLLPQTEATGKIWKNGQWPSSTLRNAL